MGCQESKNVAVRENIHEVYHIGKVLGKGGFGQVRECVHRVTGETFAVKIMEKKPNETGRWSSRNMFWREVEFLQFTANSNVLQYIDCYEDRRHLYAVVECCHGGQLLEHLNTCQKITEEEILLLSRQMLQAIAYLHSCNIAHRDIKAENFLFKHNSPGSELKLIDFGMAAKMTSANAVMTDLCGSPNYFSPELINNKYNLKTDMWALGVVVYLLLFRRYPYPGSTFRVLIKDILSKPVDYTYDKTTMSISDDALDFVQSLLKHDPEKRLSAEEALQHSWITQETTKLKFLPSENNISFLETDTSIGSKASL